MVNQIEIDRVIEISMELSPTPIDDNYWRNLIAKSLTDEPMSIYQAFELGRFSERMMQHGSDMDDRNKPTTMTHYFSSALRYKQSLQSKFSKIK